MGKVEPLTIIEDPAAWLARDYPDPAAYAYHLSPADLAELDAAVASASAAVAGGKEVQVCGSGAVQREKGILRRYAGTLKHGCGTSVACLVTQRGSCADMRVPSNMAAELVWHAW